MAYIDKDLLLKDIGESVVFTVRNAETSPQIRGARKIIDRIKNSPTADVGEVKHGEWKWDEKFYDYTCSLCHNWDLTTPNYCSNCGAKMGGTPKERGSNK